jgi:hypothetical protein
MEWWKLWNDGFKEIKNQSAYRYRSIDFLVTREYFRDESRRMKAEDGCLKNIIKRCRFNII